MDEKELVKLKEKIVKNMDIYKDVNEAWCGSFVLADGYRLSYAASPDAKMRVAKAEIKDEFANIVIAKATERGCAIFSE